MDPWITLFFVSVVLIVVAGVLDNRRLRRKASRQQDSHSRMIDWYRIHLDDDGIRLEVSPPEHKAWSATIRWEDLRHVVFETGDMLESDTIYLFASTREASWVVPVDGVGGDVLLDALITRRFLDAEAMIAAASAPPGVRVESGTGPKES